VELAVGERYELPAADGKIAFSITVVSVDTELVCPAADSLPAENGHLVGLHAEVLAEPSSSAEGGPAAAFSAADFRFLGADGVLTADVDTAGSAACLGEASAWPAGQPVQGTLVLDVPATSGTIVYQPASWPAGLRWQV
jgi:hypothetical protein